RRRRRGRVRGRVAESGITVGGEHRRRHLLRRRRPALIGRERLAVAVDARDGGLQPLGLGAKPQMLEHQGGGQQRARRVRDAAAAMSGAEPCTDSKYAQPLSPKLAEGATPRPPATSPATSDRMSPYWFMHTRTSMVLGNRMMRRAASSTWKCSNARSGYVATVSLTVAWKRPSVCGSTLDFVTQVSLPAWPRALRRRGCAHA